jgi:heptosyltransferase-2
MENKTRLVKNNCKYFKGDIPCKFHKMKGVHCENCEFYNPIDKRILIIKLGAMGDIVRTTPILTKLKEVYPESEITWVTYYPKVVPNIVDKVLFFDVKALSYLLADEFDILFNLDKDLEAVSLAKNIKAGIKKGFVLKYGKCMPLDKSAVNKWNTGIFDDINRSNDKSYPQEVFEICGFKFNKEEYVVDVAEFKWNLDSNRPLIGLNTGCGSRWITRKWPVEKWVELSFLLQKKGFGVLLLGGKQEHKQNETISKKTGALYVGYFPIDKFINLVNQVDLLVTVVTGALHVAIGLKKKIVLLNNIFNKKEFELYDRGIVVEPSLECLGCFKNKFDSNCPVSNCMDLISSEQIYKTILEVL